MCKTAVYVAQIPERDEFSPVYPPERQAEIERYSNPKVRSEKYFVWKLLEYALADSFGMDITELSFEKNENGKWTSDKIFFSLSHTNGAVAVALSLENVGVDVEAVRRHREGLEEKILTPTELCELAALGSEEAAEYVIKRWSQKESIFKTLDRQAFLPSTIASDEFSVHTRKVELSGQTYMLSVCANDAKNAKFNICNNL